MMVLPTHPSKGRGRQYHHQCSLGSATSYLIYADVRLRIPMTHHNDVGQNRRIAAEDADGAGCHPLCECEKCTAAATDPDAATVYACNPDGRTSLHVAANMGHVDIVQLLLDKGAEVNLFNAHANIPRRAAQRQLLSQ